MSGVRVDIVVVKSNNYYIFWVCVCSFSYAAWNAHALYCHLWPLRVLSHFFTLSHKRHDFRQKRESFWTWTVFWFSLQILPETFRMLRRIQRNVKTASCKVPVIFVKKWPLNSLDWISKNTQISGFMKICPVGAELFHADGRIEKRTDGQKKRKSDRHAEAYGHICMFAKRLHKMPYVLIRHLKTTDY